MRFTFAGETSFPPCSASMKAASSSTVLTMPPAACKLLLAISQAGFGPAW